MKKHRLIPLSLVVAALAKAAAVFILLAVVTFITIASIYGRAIYRVKNAGVRDITLDLNPPTESNSVVRAKLLSMPEVWFVPENQTNGVVEMSDEDALEMLEGVFEWTFEVSTDNRMWVPFGVPFPGNEKQMNDERLFLMWLDWEVDDGVMRIYRARHE